MALGGSYTRRIEKEIKNLSKPGEDMGLYQIFPSHRNFYGFIRGPNDSPFENGYYKLFIHLHKDYPFSPPVIKFMTKVYHPNISSQTGAICLDILKEKWTAALSLSTTLLSIISLLTDPVPEDPQDSIVADEFVHNRDEYDRKAKQWNDDYARESQITDNELLVSKLSNDYDVDVILDAASHNMWTEEQLRSEIERMGGNKSKSCFR